MDSAVSAAITPRFLSTLPSGAYWRWVIAILSASAIAARIRSFGNPIVFIDEEFYALVARAMWRGALPYVDIWDRKPIGLFLLYLPAAPWSPQIGVYVYQAIALVAVISTAALVVVLARGAGWRRGALVSGVLYIFWLDFADGQSGQSPVYYNLPMIGAVALAALAREPRRRQAATAAMVLVGIALQIKYSVVFEGGWIGLWLVRAEYLTTRSVPKAISFGAMLALIALAPTAISAAWYVHLGHGQDFLFANFRSVLLRHADPVSMQIDNAVVALELLGPLVGMALIGMGVAARGDRERTVRVFLHGWLGVSLLGFVAFGGWYNHYTLPVMMPGCLCTAPFFGDRRVGRWLAAPTVVLAFFVGQRIMAREMQNRGRPDQFATLVKMVGPGPGSLYVDMGNPALYSFTGRPALSRYAFPSHLQIAREAGAVGVDEAAELDRIFAQRPDVVTLQGPDNGSSPERMAQVQALVARGGYARPLHLTLGGQWVDIYRLKTAHPSPAAR